MPEPSIKSPNRLLESCAAEVLLQCVSCTPDLDPIKVNTKQTSYQNTSTGYKHCIGFHVQYQENYKFASPSQISMSRMNRGRCRDMECRCNYSPSARVIQARCCLQPKVVAPRTTRHTLWWIVVWTFSDHARRWRISRFRSQENAPLSSF